MKCLLFASRLHRFLTGSRLILDHRSTLVTGPESYDGPVVDSEEHSPSGSRPEGPETERVGEPVGTRTTVGVGWDVCPFFTLTLLQRDRSARGPSFVLCLFSEIT